MIAADATLEANPTSSPSLAQMVSSGPSADALQRLGIQTPEALDDLCAKEAKRQFVVEGLVSAGSVGIVVGDSGIGKSPLLYQLALCVAAGIPWLGMSTFSGPVVYLDCENGALNSKGMRDSLLRHLGLDECPKNFLSCCDISNLNHLTLVVDATKPTLVVIDTLRSFDPAAEKDNTAAGTFIKALRRIGKHPKTAFLLIHHPKKHDGGFFGGVPGLEATPVIQWSSQACGARALINQTDVRIGMDHTTKGEASLVVKANLRVQGDIGPFYLERVLDDDQQAVGYSRLTGVVELLGSKDQEKALSALPEAFSFKEAKFAYERGNQATTDFLGKCIQLGLIRKPTKGRYEKVLRAEPK
jgi:AAA domain